MQNENVRVYSCSCGGRCVRPLIGEPKPCDSCGKSLSSMVFRGMTELQNVAEITQPGDADKAESDTLDVAVLLEQAKNCRKRGGNCKCCTYCESEQKLARAAVELQSQLSEVNAAIEWLQHKPCTVRPDWKRPEPPAGDYTLMVRMEDAWIMEWYSETEEIDVIEVPHPDSWPFVESVAYTEDWQRLGIEVL